MAVGRMAERLAGDQTGVLWRTYLDLEIFNRPRYEAAAAAWGLDVAPGLFTKLKAWAVSSVPKVFLGLLLKVVYSETLKYMEWLRDLSREGPADSRAFLEYMVAQEEMQIEMMLMALQGRDSEIVHFADEFFLRYNGLLMAPGEPTPREFA